MSYTIDTLLFSFNSDIQENMYLYEKKAYNSPSKNMLLWSLLKTELSEGL